MLKSVLVGLLFVIIAFVVTAIVMIALLFFRKPPEGIAYGWDPISYAKSTMAWAISLAAFVLGFIWEYRRLHH